MIDFRLNCLKPAKKISSIEDFYRRQRHFSFRFHIIDFILKTNVYLLDHSLADGNDSFAQ